MSREELITGVQRLPKLVRDYWPARIAHNGDIPFTHRANDEEFRQLLREKVREEAREVAEAPESDIVAEAGDLLFALRVLVLAHDRTWSEVEDSVKAKCEEIGGFANRVVLHGVRLKEGQFIGEVREP